MPRFYFNLSNRRETLTDEDGTELEGIEQAYLQAFKSAQEIWSELLVSRRDPRQYAFDICDAARVHLMTLPFVEVLESCKTDPPRTGPVNATEVIANGARARQSLLALGDEMRRIRDTVRAARELIATSADRTRPR